MNSQCERKGHGYPAPVNSIQEEIEKLLVGKELYYFDHTGRLSVLVKKTKDGAKIILAQKNKILAGIHEIPENLRFSQRLLSDYRSDIKRSKGLKAVSKKEEEEQEAATKKAEEEAVAEAKKAEEAAASSAKKADEEPEVGILPVTVGYYGQQPTVDIEDGDWSKTDWSEDDVCWSQDECDQN